MKAKLLLIVLAASLLFSCKKDQQLSSPQSNIATTFDVTSSLTATSTTLAASGKQSLATGGSRIMAAPIQASTKFLTALFYDSNSKLLQRIDQKQGSVGYGTFTTQLPLGTVHAFFVATDDNSFTLNMSKTNSKGIAQMPNGYPAISYDSGFFGPPTTNLFSTYKKLNITAPSTQAIVCTRIASQITIKVNDYIEPNTYYNYNQTYPNNQFDLLDQIAEHTNSITFASQTLDPTVGQTGYSYTVLVYPGTGSKHNFTDNKVTKTLFASTDTIKANTKYTFEGYMSNLRSSTGTITTDTTWNAPVNKPLAIKHTQN